LYRGLKGLPDGKAGKLASSAVEWLEVHRLVHDASYVLAPLLERPDLTKEAAEQAVTAALTWLADADQGISSDARFVLPPLLGRPDLTKEAAEQAIAAALTWLADAEHEISSNAGFVLSPLLERPDLPKEAAEQAIAAALIWLGKHFETQGAEFVLKFLLGKGRLGEDRKLLCVKLAIQRLEKIYLSSEA